MTVLLCSERSTSYVLRSSSITSIYNHERYALPCRPIHLLCGYYDMKIAKQTRYVSPRMPNGSGAYEVNFDSNQSSRYEKAKRHCTSFPVASP